MALRLRQIAFVAPELGAPLEAMRDALGVEVCYHDRDVAQFGLENALFPVGEQFLEIVSPIEDGTTAGRLLDRRGGAGGYMAIFQCDDLDRRRAHLDEVGVRAVWTIDLRDARSTHLHPRDIGGAIVSLDEVVPWESWRWAGRAWQDHVHTDVVRAIRGLTVSAGSPAEMAARWAEVLEVDPPIDDQIQVGDVGITFVPAGDRGDGLDGVELEAAERARAGTELELCGVRIRLT